MTSVAAGTSRERRREGARAEIIARQSGDRHSDIVPRSLALLFAPIHKRALGTAVGLVCAAALAGVTAFHLLLRPVDAPNLDLLAHYFSGYRVSWPGAAIGGFWGFATGFVAGWSIGFVRNLVIAVYMFVIRTKAELLQSRDFLDHI